MLPDLLAPDHMARLKAETARLETTRVDYSVHQRYCTDIQWAGGLLTELVAHKPTIAFLGELLGEEILVANYVYARSEPGHPGISLHTDGGQPLWLQGLRVRSQRAGSGPGTLLPGRSNP